MQYIKECQRLMSFYQLITPPKFNIEPENDGFQK